MAKKVLAVLAIAAWFVVSAAAQEQQQQEPQKKEPQVKIGWQAGPTTGKLGDIAEIKIPEGYEFADKEGAQKVLELTHNLTSGRELGVIVSRAKDSSWFMIFEFDDTGYVKDEEGDHLDSSAILKNIKENTEEANQERRKRGWKAFHVIGWQVSPFYDPHTHNLTWASQISDDGQKTDSVNHSIRILGRRGTMNVDLVASPEEYAASKAEFDDLISGFTYVQGSRYSDFTKGDKVAEYGLTALIVGGAGAVALKTGLLAKFWKFIVMGIVAIGSFIKKIFNSLFGKEEKVEDPNPNHSDAASAGE